MTEPAFDPTADPVDVETAEHGAWISQQLHALVDIQSRKKDLEGEREAIMVDLVPVMKALGKPVVYRDHDGAPKVSTIREDTVMTVDLEVLEGLVDMTTFSKLPIKRTIASREAFEHWAFTNNVPFEVLAPAVSTKTKKAYAHLG